MNIKTFMQQTSELWPLTAPVLALLHVFFTVMIASYQIIIIIIVVVMKQTSIIAAADTVKVFVFNCKRVVNISSQLT
jgi:hypothetical protein